MWKCQKCFSALTPPDMIQFASIQTTIYQSRGGYAHCGVAQWLSGRVSDLWSRGRGFEPRPRRCCTTTLGKLFTPHCLCHQSVQFGTSESWEVNRHTTWCTSPVTVILQIYLVSGWGLQKRRSAPPYELLLGEEPSPLPMLTVPHTANCLIITSHFSIKTNIYKIFQQ